ncbi:MAG TPA: hypothetical protein VGO16_07670 [Pseudonocardiaceae bacterium]|nr:hypothetical protein [Pseudonocardiaceae bacterium]
MTKRRILWWFLLPLLTFGMATFAVVGYAGGRLRSRWHLAAAAGYFLLFVGFVVGGLFTDPEKAGVVDAIMTQLFLVNWLVGSAHAGWLERRLKVRRSTVEAPSPADPAVLVAQQRLARRNEARALLTSNPALAAELRIGRPDLRRQYDDGGLVDINQVPAEMIASELGIPFLVAEEIVVQRTRVGGFYTADDLVVYCEGVNPYQVAVVRDRLLFTPT